MGAWKMLGALGDAVHAVGEGILGRCGVSQGDAGCPNAGCPIPVPSGRGAAGGAVGPRVLPGVLPGVLPSPML